MAVQFNKFPAAAIALHEAVAEIVAEVAVDIADEAQTYAPVDTGFLMGSIYYETWGGNSTYGSGPPPPSDDVYLLPSEGPSTDLEAVVGVAANYGIYVEMGTRSMGAQPYFYPAVDSGRNDLQQKLGGIEPRIRGKIR